MKKIGFLTSSRADFGIYLPLLQKLKNDADIKISIIAFGTHLSRFHGYTLHNIEETGFTVDFRIESLLTSDSAEANSTATALTALKFSSFWGEHHDDFDLVFCLGDRYEMFAAVMAAVPFGVKFAHLHGGEITLGATDNIYRHAITLASTFHFTATEIAANRVKEILGRQENIYATGSLSVDSILHVPLLSKTVFKKKWNINFDHPTILVTYHPETVAYNSVEEHVNILVETLQQLSEQYQVMITMPNADTLGSLARAAFMHSFSGKKEFFLYENLGTESYFTAINYCSFLLGNTSSGIIEAASFKKFVIDLGSRQAGRYTSENILHANFVTAEIMEKVRMIEHLQYVYRGENIYHKPGTASSISCILKSL